MKLPLSHHWYAGGVREFDTESGAVTRTDKYEWGKTGVFGLLWKQNGKWFAFYKDDESLLLQHKSNKWRVTPEYQIKHAGLIFRRFQVFHHGQRVFSIRYKVKGLLFWFIDPTYDGIDAETDDFFLYVSSMWKSWQNKPISEFEKQIDEAYV